MKRRVIAIAVVLAAVGVCVPLWVNEGPLWRAVMLKREVVKRADESDDSYYEIAYKWRVGPHRNQPEGFVWFHWPRTHVTNCFEWENGSPVVPVVRTYWDAAGNVFRQHVDNVDRFVPPWLPHPPLIDLREFEK